MEEQKKQLAINLVKPIFEKYNAINKENTMTKEEVLAEIENPNGKKYFNYLKSLRILEKESGKYYYNVEKENNTKAQKPIGTIFTIIVFAILIVSVVGIVFRTTNTTKTIKNEDVSFEIPIDWNVYEEYSQEYGWTYFKYISALPISTENESKNEIDYTTYPASLAIAYDQEATGLYDSIDELKQTLEIYIQAQLQPEEYYIDTFTTEKGYSAIKATIKYTNYPEEIDYYYYIYKDGKLGYITAITLNMNDEQELNETALNVANSFEWKK